MDLVFLSSSGNELFDPFRSQGLRALNWQTHGTSPDQVGENTESTGNTEENSVVVFFMHTESSEEDTRVSIDIGPWVLGLTLLGEDTRNDGIKS